ncbi:MAG: TnpV protein [Lachnospiraceae bacterium]|nr:TnpV protein [Lachnospiraceae bacterium]
MAELTYRKNGDYLIPDLIMDGEDEGEEILLGKYGLLRQTFLKEHHHGTYTSMLLTGRLMPHLKQIDDQAQEQADRMVAEMMKQNGVDEEMKERDQMAWVQAVNGYTAQAEEVVLKEIVYR